MAKERLDKVIKRRFNLSSREVAQGLIMTGQVIVDNDKETKPGTMIDPESPIRLLKTENKYVSRGAEKLKGAHQAFNLDFNNKVILDVGISTGGFTDYALQQGAKRVFGVDVGYGQVAMKLVNDDRVVIMERLNARHLTPELFKERVPRRDQEALSDLEKISMVVMDVSFISVTKILPVLPPLVTDDCQFVILIKPQFEAERHEIGKGGIVRDDATRNLIVTRTLERLHELGFTKLNLVESPIQGTKGNQEFVAIFMI